MNRQKRLAAETANRRLFGVMEPSDSSAESDSDSSEQQLESEEEDLVLSSSDSSSDDTDDIVLPAFPSASASPLKTVSKDGEEWTNDPVQPISSAGRQRQENILREAAGAPKVVLQKAGTPLGAFLCFFTGDMLQLVVQHTNEEGESVMGNKWRAIDTEELHTYMGLLLLAGVYRSKHESVSHLWNSERGRPVFSRAMTRDRFQNITRCLRFDSKTTRAERQSRDKLAPIRLFSDMFAAKCRANYRPGASVTIDEQLVIFRGRCPFKVYIPSKPGKYGIKIWVCADVETSYCYNFDVYTGKIGRQPEIGQGARVVLQLSEPLAGSGRSVTGDNFFSSLLLARGMLGRKLTYIGTVRRNKAFLPASITSVQGRAELSTTFAFQRDVTLMSYLPKKGTNVILISTQHHTPVVYHERPDKKPEMILEYNRTKGAVDNLDKLIRTYSSIRKNRRWPMVLFMNFLDIAAYNSLVLFLCIHPNYMVGKSHRRRLYLEELASSLIGTPIGETQSKLFPQQLSNPSSTRKRQRCGECPRDADRKTAEKCRKCMKALCKDHINILCSVCSHQ